jgi:hypothetical protein
MSLRIRTVAVETLISFVIIIQISHGSTKLSVLAQASNDASGKRVTPLYLRRCVSLSSEMSREADISNSWSASCSPNAYTPVHTLVPRSIRENLSINEDISESSNRPSPPETPRMDDLPHLRTECFDGFGSPRADRRIYTKIQTKLYPHLRF